MVGKTNARSDIRNFAVDEHTLFLLTDTLEDKSNYHIPVQSYGVTIDNVNQRDNRNSLYFLNTSFMHFTYTDTPIATMWKRQPWTIECWVRYISGTDANGYGRSLVDIEQRTGFSYDTMLFLHNGTNLYVSKNGSSSWNAYNGFDTSIRWTANTWTHVALVLDPVANLLRFFQDGVQKKTNGDTGEWTVQSGLVHINDRHLEPTHGSGFTMNLQDFRISNVARYTANFTPPQRFL